MTLRERSAAFRRKYFKWPASWPTVVKRTRSGSAPSVTSARRPGVAYHHKQNGEWALGSSFTDPTRQRVMLNDGRALTMDEYRSLFGQTPAELSPTIVARVGKKAAGRELDGREWNEFPTVRS